MSGICVSIKYLKKRIQTKPIKCLKYIIVESMIYDSIFHTLYCCLLLLDLTTDGQVKPHNEDKKQTKEIHQVDKKWNEKNDKQRWQEFNGWEQASIQNILAKNWRGVYSEELRTW